jgi:DNA-binding CsgD family transcriptional regulator
MTLRDDRVRVRLLGRDHTVDVLRSRMDLAGTGRGSAVLVSGEPGIGKSALLALAAAECADFGMRVLSGTADGLARRRPFAAIGACFGFDRPGAPSDVADVADLLRASTVAGLPLGTTQLESAVTEALLGLLERWCAEQPVALLLDDLQWADPVSLVVLHRLGRVINQLPLLLVCAHRPLPVGAELAGLIRGLADRGAAMLELEPLDAVTTERLAGDVLGADVGPTVSRLMAGAAGNPLFVTELVSSLKRERMLTTVDGVAELAVEPTRVPDSLSGVVLRRLEFLDPRTQWVLRFAAVLGGGATLTELAAVTNIAPLKLWTRLRDAVDAGLLVESEDRLVFRHELIRQALLSELPQAVRRGMLLQISHVLADAGAPVERVAEYLAACEVLDVSIVDWLARSAETLIARAPTVATELLEYTVTRLSQTHPLADLLRLSHVQSLLWAGRSAAAERAGRTALARNGDPTLEGRLRWLIALACERRGDLPGAIAVAEAAITSLSPDSVEVARFEGFLAQCHFLLDDAAETRRHALRAKELGERLGDPYATVAGLHLSATVYYRAGDFVTALDMASTAMAAWGDKDPPLDATMPTAMFHGACLMELDQFDAAESSMERGLRISEVQGSPTTKWHYLTLAALSFHRGHWDDSLARIAAGQDIPDPLRVGAALSAQQAIILCRRGERDLPVVRGEPFAAGGAVRYEALRRWAVALSAERAGDPAAALTIYLATSDNELDHHLWPDTARVAFTTGAVSVLRDLVPETDRMAQRLGTPLTLGTAALVRGMLDSDLDLVLESARIYERGGRPLPRALACECAALVAAGLGETRLAGRAVEDALEVYTALGARWDIERCEGQAQRAGVRVRRTGRGRAGRPESGWESLTPTELRVASLVARGMSNPDIAATVFVSRRTVRFHISSILRKLGVSSRVELAVIVSEHRNPPDP